MLPLVSENQFQPELTVTAPKRKTIMDSIFGSSEISLIDAFSKPMSEHLDPGKVWSSASITPEQEQRERLAAFRVKKGIQQLKPKGSSPTASNSAVSETASMMQNNLSVFD